MFLEIVPLARDVSDHLIRTVEMIELYRDLVIGTRDIYLSSLSNNLNRVMKTLTIITVIVLPLNVITGFYGMNFEYIPTLKWDFGYHAALAVMVLVAVGMVYYFYRNGWFK